MSPAFHNTHAWVCGQSVKKEHGHGRSHPSISLWRLPGRFSKARIKGQPGIAAGSVNRLIPDWHLYFTLPPIFKSLITQSGETFLTLTSLGPEKVERGFCIVPLSSNQTRWTWWPPFFVSTSACCATTHLIPGSGGPTSTIINYQGIGTQRVRQKPIYLTPVWVLANNFSSTIGTFFMQDSFHLAFF